MSSISLTWNNVVTYILFFFVYACLGWCCEVAFAAAKEKRFVNRGFLNGPLCPIYGFGVLIVLSILQPFEDSLWKLYVGSVILTTVLEFLTGLVLEKLFHTKWWDYSDTPLNIMGYVCIPFSLVWGVGCIVVVKFIHPAIAAPIRFMPLPLRIVLSVLFLTVFAIDLSATLIAIRKLNARLQKLTELAGEMHNFSDVLGKGIFNQTMRAVQAAETTEAKLTETRDGVTAYVKAKQEGFTTLVGDAKETMTDLVGDAKDAVSNLMTDAKETVTDFVGDAKDAVTVKTQAFTGFVGNRIQTLGRNKPHAEEEKRVAEIRADIEKLTNIQDHVQKRLIAAFPTLKSNEHNDALNRIREKLKRK